MRKLRRRGGLSRALRILQGKRVAKIAIATATFTVIYTPPAEE